MTDNAFESVVGEISRYRLSAIKSLFLSQSVFFLFWLAGVRFGFCGKKGHHAGQDAVIFKFPLGEM